MKTKRDKDRGARKTRRYSRFATEVLTFFSRHRTAVADQVRRFYPNSFTSDRLARMHLQTLVARGQLTVTRSSCTEPNIYLITPKGLREASAQGIKSTNTGSYRVPRSSHLTHELLITEFAVSLFEAVTVRADVNICWEERFGLVGRPAFQTLVPDYVFIFKHGLGQLFCAVEVSSGEESSVRIGEKLEKYAAWATSEEAHKFLIDMYRKHGAENPRPQFRLLVLAHNRRSERHELRLAQFFTEAFQRLSPKMCRRIWGTTVDSFKSQASVDSPVWIRARDISDRILECSAMTAHRRNATLMSQFDVVHKFTLFPAVAEATRDVAK